MTILNFDPRVQRYEPADRLLGPHNTQQTEASTAPRRLADEHDEHLHTTEERTRQEMERAYGEAGGAIHEPEPAVTAAQIMSAPVVTLQLDQTIAEARELFRRRRFRHVPVVNAQGGLAGIVSDRDILGHVGDPPDTPINGLMPARVLVASPDTSIREIAQVLFEQRIGAMPVIDSQRALAGIVTRSDILRTVVNRAPLELWV
jgi:CBS domain-containing protein